MNTGDYKGFVVTVEHDHVLLYDMNRSEFVIIPNNKDLLLGKFYKQENCLCIETASPSKLFLFVENGRLKIITEAILLAVMQTDASVPWTPSLSIVSDDCALLRNYPRKASVLVEVAATPEGLRNFSIVRVNPEYPQMEAIGWISRQIDNEFHSTTSRMDGQRAHQVTSDVTLPLHMTINNGAHGTSSFTGIYLEPNRQMLGDNTFRLSPCRSEPRYLTSYRTEVGETSFDQRISRSEANGNNTHQSADNGNEGGEREWNSSSEASEEDVFFPIYNPCSSTCRCRKFEARVYPSYCGFVLMINNDAVWLYDMKTQKPVKMARHPHFELANFYEARVWGGYKINDPHGLRVKVIDDEVTVTTVAFKDGPDGRMPHCQVWTSLCSIVDDPQGTMTGIRGTIPVMVEMRFQWFPVERFEITKVIDNQELLPYKRASREVPSDKYFRGFIVNMGVDYVEIFDIDTFEFTDLPKQQCMELAKFYCGTKGKLAVMAKPINFYVENYYGTVRVTTEAVRPDLEKLHEKLHLKFREIWTETLSFVEDPQNVMREVTGDTPAVVQVEFSSRRRCFEVFCIKKDTTAAINGKPFEWQLQQRDLELQMSIDALNPVVQKESFGVLIKTYHPCDGPLHCVIMTPHYGAIRCHEIPGVVGKWYWFEVQNRRRQRERAAENNNKKRKNNFFYVSAVRCVEIPPKLQTAVFLYGTVGIDVEVELKLSSFRDGQLGYYHVENLGKVEISARKLYIAKQELKNRRLQSCVMVGRARTTTEFYPDAKTPFRMIHVECLRFQDGTTWTNNAEEEEGYSS